LLISVGGFIKEKRIKYYSISVGNEDVDAPGLIDISSSFSKFFPTHARRSNAINDSTGINNDNRSNPFSKRNTETTPTFWFLFFDFLERKNFRTRGFHVSKEQPFFFCVFDRLIRKTETHFFVFFDSPKK
jgi:hypothetical protein